MNTGGVVKLGRTDDDYIAPSQSCIKPLTDRLKKKKRLEDANADSPKAKVSIDNSAGDFCALTLSPQSRASLAAHFNTTTSDITLRLATLFRKLGVDLLFDSNFARQFCLDAAGREFVRRYKLAKGQGSDGPHLLPIISGVCPGWVCLVEKAHGSILPYLSTVRSPQAVAGVLVKRYIAARRDISPHRVFHASVMPCYDKKLEASRPDLTVKNHIDSDDVVRETDCVISTGGYALHVLRYAVKELFRVDASVDEFTREFICKDLEELRFVDHATGEKLTFAHAYGLKNVQNLVMRIKRNKCKYDYVEAMACPSGCANGGGQIRAPTFRQQPQVLAQCQKSYSSEVCADTLVTEEVSNLKSDFFGSGAIDECSLLNCELKEVPFDAMMAPNVMQW